MDGSYRSKYYGNKKNRMYKTGTSVVAFSQLETVQGIEKTNNTALQMISTLATGIKSPILIKKDSSHLKIENQKSTNESISKSPNRSPNSRKKIVDTDEFVIFGTTRLLSTLNSVEEKKKKDTTELEKSNICLKVDMSAEEIKIDYDKTVEIEKEKEKSNIFSELMKDKEAPSLEEMERQDQVLVELKVNTSFTEPPQINDDFSALMKDKDAPSLEEMGRQDQILAESQVNTLFTELSQTSWTDDSLNLTTSKDLKNQIQHLKAKIKMYKMQITELKSHCSKRNDDEEVEIETYTETTTKMIPHLKRFDSRKYISKKFENISFEFNKLETETIFIKRDELKFKEYLPSNTEIKLFYNICTEENLQDNCTDNGKETLHEWMTEADVNYSHEQRNVIENLFQMFETNRTEFVKLIINLLAKKVKCAAVQVDLLDVSDRGTNTDVCQRNSVSCGDINSINVSVIELSKLKSVYVQVKPDSLNKFTSPLVQMLTNQCTSTASLIEYNHADIEFIVCTRNMAIQSNDGTESVGNKSTNFQTTVNQSLHDTNDNDSISDVLIGLSQSQIREKKQDYFENIKYQYKPRFDKNLTKNRLERYEILNSRPRLSPPISSSRRRKYSASISSRSNYVPFTFSEQQSSKLTKFNDFMKSAILCVPNYVTSSDNTVSENLRTNIVDPRSTNSSNSYHGSSVLTLNTENFAPNEF